MAASKSKSKIMRDHEIQVKLIQVLGSDPTAKYWLALGGGAFLTAILMAIQKPTEKNIGAIEAIAQRGAWDYVGLIAGGAQGAVLADLVQSFNDKAKDNPIGTLIGMTATWTGLNAVCLVLSSASGGKEGGGMLTKLLAVP